MSTHAQKPATRRALPQARPASPRYELVLTDPHRPSRTAAVFSFFKELFGRGGDAVGDAYAASARAVLERKEALEDLGAERRHKSRAAAEARAAARPRPTS